MVPVAARPGGAVDMSAGGEPPVGVDALVERLMTRVERAHARRERRKKDAFLFAVDHCFPIKGQGTVLTGTVLSGKCAVGDVIELPNPEAGEEGEEHADVQAARAVVRARRQAGDVHHAARP